SGEDSNATGDFDILGKAGGGNLTIQNTSNGKVVVDGNHLDRVFDINPTPLFTANLNGAQQVPPTNSHATGAASILVNSGQQTITFSGSFSGLQGQPTAFELHEASAGSTGPLAKDANGNNIQLTNLPHATSGTAGAQTFSINGTFLNQLVAGKFYVELSTTAFSSGEIRGQLAPVSPPFTVTMMGFTITGGATPAADLGPGSGGGIEDQGNVNLTLNNMIVTGNSAHHDGGGIAMWNVSNLSWTMTLNNSTISNNNTGHAGGGIFTNGTGTVAIGAGNAISGNVAYDQGGGIELDSIGPASANLTVDGSVVSNNQAFSVIGYGGGIGNDGNGVVTIRNSTVQNNSAGTTGGGFGDAHGLGSLTVLNSFFTNNTASGNGGGIATSGPSTAITSSEIDGNASGGSGGGIFTKGATLTLQNSTLANNSAAAGGGIEIDTTGPNSTITDTTITGDSAKTSTAGSGGGIDAGSGFTGNLKLLNDTINGNSATTGGGVFWAAQSGSNFSLQNTILARNLAGTGPDAVAKSAFSDQGGNLIGVSGSGSGNTGFTSSATQTGTVINPLDPRLGPLGNNGGPTVGAGGTSITLQTEALLSGSPAIGKGILSGAPANDERGLPSVTNGTINVGAVSLIPQSPPNSSLPDGTLLVSTLPSQGFASGDQSGFPTGILGVDLHTAAQTPISSGGLFAVPTYITEGPNLQLYVTDLQAFGTGAVLAIDPNTGAQRLIAKGGFINGPNTLLYLNGFLYVANEGDASGMVHNIVRVDPNTGAQKLITDGSNGGFIVPVGMAQGPGDSIYIADEPGQIQGTDLGKVWLVNLDTGQQTLVSSNNSTQGVRFNHPQDIAVDGTGNLLVLNGGNNGFSGDVVRINPQTGVQTLVSFFSGWDHGGVDGIEVNRDGVIYVGALSYGNVPARIYAVDPVTGAQSIVAEGGQLSEVEGIRFFHVTVGGSATVGTRAKSPIAGQTVAWIGGATGSSSGAPAWRNDQDGLSYQRGVASLSGWRARPEPRSDAHDPLWSTSQRRSLRLGRANQRTEAAGVRESGIEPLGLTAGNDGLPLHLPPR
ncbi:MAG TPA: CHRD domain-containing protein, partial [Gemmataceae bacterium]|nr:CHRD domain-containing protein [Gemmataceae bacterium]